MYKKELIKEIAIALVSIKKHSYKDISYILADELDLLIFNTSDKWDRNLKYEIRNFLKMLNFITYISIAKHDVCFVVNISQIKKHYGIDAK